MLKVALARSDGRHSGKHVALVLTLLLLLAGVASSAVGKHHLARSKPLIAIQREKQLGPNPTPHWYWRWVPWRLGEGFAKGHLRAADLRPKQAPHRIPHWAWRRLHLFLRARASASKGHRSKQTTSTGTRTTTPFGGETYQKAISYTRNRPPFTPRRTVSVSSASQLHAALSNLQPGDLVKATASFTVSNSSSSALIIKNRLSAPAEIDLTGVKIVYTGTQQPQAVWLNNASNLYIFGGDISTSDTGGVCLRVYGSQHVLWWGFTAHDCGATGFQAQAIGGPVDHDDFQGTIWKVGQNLAWDPHTEKGTGLHAANLWDANSTGNFTNNRFAFYAHDIPVGACVEYGNNQASGNRQRPLPQVRQRDQCRADTNRRQRPPDLGEHTTRPGLRREVPRRRQPPGLRLPRRRHFLRAERLRHQHRVWPRVEHEPKPPLRRPEPLGLERRRGLQGASASSVID